MSDDPQVHGPGITVDPMVQQAIIAAITQGGGLMPLLGVLTQSQLSPEQQTAMSLLQALNGGETASNDTETATEADTATATVDSADEDDDDDDDDVPRVYYQRPRHRADTTALAARFRRLERELSDLRQVNDTTAAALGACRVCWGGDPDCPECAGRGHPGAARPDVRLFQALVVPAVRRVCAERRARPRPRGYGHAHRSPTPEEASP